MPALVRSRPLLAGLLILVLAALAIPAAGQVFVDASQPVIELRPGQTSTFNVTLTNPTDRGYFVSATPSGNLSGSTELDPRRFPLTAQGNASTDVAVSLPEDSPFEEGDLRLRFTIIDRQSGEPIEQTIRVHLTVERAPLLLGIFDNPLPPTFQDGWGMFAAELAAWLLIAGMAASLLGVLIHRAISNAELFVQDEMAAMVKAPVFYLITVLGLNFSWRLVPVSPVIEVIDSLLNAVAVVVAGVLAYRATGAGLYYYGQNIAGKTETKVDDVLIPVLEKLSAAVIIGLAAFYTFQILGVDLSFLVAGGIVAGLVISMAAQDTLSNFFSGIYLLIDRPFREGDDIELESGEVCRVDDVGMRSCRLYHYRNHQQVIVPNNDLATKRVVNLSYPDDYYRIVIPVGVAYDTDVQHARDVLYRVAMDREEVQKGRNTSPRVFVKEFGDSAIVMELRAFVTGPRERNPVRTELIQAIKETFDEESIEIPFPQRVLWIQGDGEAKPPEQIETLAEVDDDGAPS